MRAKGADDEAALASLGPAAPPCEALDVCGAPKFVCVAEAGGNATNKFGQTLAEITNVLSTSLAEYDALGRLGGPQGRHHPARRTDEIAGLGPDLRGDLAVGDRVTFETDAYLCGTCLYCRAEQYQRCPYRKGIGTTADGALADSLVMPELAVHRLPDGVSLLSAALTEPLSIAVHAVIERSPSLADEVVLITGPGAIGALTSAVATGVGATTVLIGRSRHAGALADALERGIAIPALNSASRYLADSGQLERLVAWYSR